MNCKECQFELGHSQECPKYKVQVARLARGWSVKPFNHQESSNLSLHKENQKWRKARQEAIKSATERQRKIATHYSHLLSAKVEHNLKDCPLLK